MLVACAHADEYDKIDLHEIRLSGCSVDNIPPRWHVHVWVNQADADDCQQRVSDRQDPLSHKCSYMRLLSIRDDQAAAMKDCTRWMKGLHKRLEDARKAQERGKTKILKKQNDSQ